MPLPRIPSVHNNAVVVEIDETIILYRDELIYCHKCKTEVAHYPTIPHDHTAGSWKCRICSSSAAEKSIEISPN